MKRIALIEHGRLYHEDAPARMGGEDRKEVSAKQFEILRRHDEKLAEKEGRQIFDWRVHYAKASEWVGVLEVPGLSVEILPKVESAAAAEGEREASARKNFLYMLALSGVVPARERDLADQTLHKSSLMEALIRLFSKRLVRELSVGRVHNYVGREDDLPVLKGKLLFSRHLKNNLVRKDRFSVRYEEFSADTLTNRILKAACRRLLNIRSKVRTRESLTYALDLLDDVSEQRITNEDFSRLVINRQNERFEELLNFSRLVLQGRAPTSSQGALRTFSLLFDMNHVYESFVTELVRRYVMPQDDFIGCSFYPQARRRKRHLVYRPPEELPASYRPGEHGRGVLRLKADLFFERRDDERRMVIDTKWKRLGEKDRAGREDLYQLFAYARNFDSRDNVLLYPAISGTAAQVSYDLPWVEGADADQRIHIRFLRLDRDLRLDRKKIVQELSELLEPMTRSAYSGS